MKSDPALKSTKNVFYCIAVQWIGLFHGVSVVGGVFWIIPVSRLAGLCFLAFCAVIILANKKPDHVDPALCFVL